MAPWFIARCWDRLAGVFRADEESVGVHPDDKTQTACSDPGRSTSLDITAVIDCSPAVLERSQHSSASMRNAEKRLATRYPCDRDVRCAVNAGHGERLFGRCRNLSRGGMGIVVRDRISAGTVLVVELLGRAGATTHSVQVCVVHVRPMPFRGWFLGCAFPEELPDTELKTLI
jgi:hypothetical protein